MRKGKLYRYNAIKEMDIVYEYPENIAGKWSTIFENDNPIILELACGRGEYSIGLAKLYPDKNFIGVDIKGERIFVGANQTKRENLNNVRFLRTQIAKIEEYFQPNEVDEIWLPFPDPQLRLSKMGKRLTHPNFLRKYQNFLKKGASIHLKTDSPNLYWFTKGVIEYLNLNKIEDIPNLRDEKQVKKELLIETFYQKLDIAGKNKVHYLQFQLNDTIPEIDKNKFKEFIEKHMEKTNFSV